MSLLLSLGLIHQLMNVYCLPEGFCLAGLALCLDPVCLDEGKVEGLTLGFGVSKALSPDPRAQTPLQGQPATGPRSGETALQKTDGQQCLCASLRRSRLGLSLDLHPSPRLVICWSRFCISRVLAHDLTLCKGSVSAGMNDVATCPRTSSWQRQSQDTQD